MNNNHDYFASLQDQEQDEALEILADVFKVRAAAVQEEEHPHKMERRTSDTTTETSRSNSSRRSSSSQGSLYEELVQFQRTHSIGLDVESPNSRNGQQQQQQQPLPTAVPRRASYDGHFTTTTKTPVSMEGISFRAPPRSTYRPPLSRDCLQKRYLPQEKEETTSTRLPIVARQHPTVPLLRRASTIPEMSLSRQQILRETQLKILETLKKEQEAKRIMERNDEAYARRLQLELNAMSLKQQEVSSILEPGLQGSAIITEENHDDEVLNFVLELSRNDETDDFNTAIAWEDVMVVNKPSYMMDTSFSTADTLSLSWDQSPTSSPFAASNHWCTSASTNDNEDHPQTMNTHRNRSGSRSTTRPSTRRD
jgi:hypothetical protein